MLRERGVASLTEAITLGEGLAARVLATADGERTLTDLRHVGQLLHAAATAEQLGATALTSWLRRRIAEAERDTADEERSRRLESDAEAVQVLTIHRSKGLEFPIVYYPFLWETGYEPKGVPVVYHDPDAGDRRTLDVGLEGAGFQRHRQQQLVEERGEDLRLAYVALTRAQHQAVVWWAGSFDSRNSPLGRLLFARDAGRRRRGRRGRRRSDAEAVERLEALAARRPAASASSGRSGGSRARWSGPPRAPAELVGRALRRASSTGAGAAPPTATSPPARTSRAWRASRRSRSSRTSRGARRCAAADPAAGTPRCAPCPRCWPGCPPACTPARSCTGCSSGPTSPRPTSTPSWRRRSRRPAGTLEIGDAGAVVRGLRAALETPLGPLLGGLRLRDVRRADRLDELTFELPLAGGDAPTGRLALDAIAAVLRAHLPPGDPLAGYADRLADPALRRSVRGYLTGSIDLVVRTGGGLRDRRLQDELARAARRGAERLAPPAGRARRGDGARALRPAGAALHRRPAPLPALAPARLRPRSATSPASSTCSCAA